METVKAHFQGKRITVMGLGVLGRGVGDAQFLAECGADVLVTDMKSPEELAESVAALGGYDNITFVLGEHRETDFRNTDMVIKAAGVPLDSPYIAAARDAGVRVEMSTSLFAQLSPATIVGVTGTRGKSSVTHLLADVLHAAGHNVFLGGNVKGVSTLAHLPESTADEIAVLELDSWQLQGFGDAQISPHVAIFTSFFADHMNYYADDPTDPASLEKGMERYLRDKTHIFRWQSSDDYLVVGEQASSMLAQYTDEMPGQTIYADAKTIPPEWQLQVPGEHNRTNIACVMEAARVFEVPTDVLRTQIESFRGVPGRLEQIGEYGGVHVYNDTTATTPDATIAALNALGGRTSKSSNLILIAGGADKSLSLNGLGDVIEKTCKEVILLAGSGTDRLTQQLSDGSYTEVDSINDAVATAFSAAREGDVILLSPGFASFNMFVNEFDRGQQFQRAVDEHQT